MAINKPISSQNAVMQAKEEVGLEGVVRFDALFKLWARQCDDRIGTTETSLTPQYVCGTVENCKIELPCHAVAIYPVIFFGKPKCDDCLTFFSYLQEILHMDNARSSGGFFNLTFQGFTYQYAITEFKIQHNKICFNDSTLNGKEVFAVVLGRETDEQGYVMVHPLYHFPIVEFIKWQYAKRSQFTGIPYRFRPSEIVEFAREYHKQVRFARGEAAQTTPAGEERIKNMINSSFSGTAHIDFMFNYAPDII